MLLYTDAIQPSANRVLQPQDAREELKPATGIEVTHLDICSFQERVDKPFIRLVSRFRFSSNDVLSAFTIFDRKKVPSLSTMSYLYKRQFNSNSHWTVRESLPVKSKEGTEFEKAAIVSSDISTEWKMYRQLRSQKMIYPCT